jgi:16S rRNA (adenine1518-N6/adenine1519-N6)-dimethyltransferase
VLEIGPGIGVLTRELAKLADNVISVELDERLIPILGETLTDFPNTRVIQGDAMKLDLNRIMSEYGGTWYVCANIPYYITSPLIMKLLEENLNVKAITLMVQKEAAVRICAPIPSRQSGALTVAVRRYAAAKKLFDVSAGSFMPAPKVDSSVIRLDLHDTPLPRDVDGKTFSMTVKAAFGQRRKTLLNAVSSGLCVSKEVSASLLDEAQIPHDKRAEQLTFEQFEKLSRAINIQIYKK